MKNSPNIETITRQIHPREFKVSINARCQQYIPGMSTSDVQYILDGGDISQEMWDKLLAYTQDNAAKCIKKTNKEK